MRLQSDLIGAVPLCFKAIILSDCKANDLPDPISFKSMYMHEIYS